MQKTIEELCCELVAAKNRETSANVERVRIEGELLLLTGLPEEGSKTVEAPGWKVRVEQKITRRIDGKKWALVAGEIPKELQPVSIVEEYKVEAKGVRWLKDNEPGYYKLLCSAMEEKPAKPSVKVEANETH